MPVSCSAYLWNISIHQFMAIMKIRLIYIKKNTKKHWSSWTKIGLKWSLGDPLSKLCLTVLSAITKIDFFLKLINYCFILLPNKLKLKQYLHENGLFICIPGFSLIFSQFMLIKQIAFCWLILMKYHKKNILLRNRWSKWDYIGSNGLQIVHFQNYVQRPCSPSTMVAGTKNRKLTITILLL